MASPSTSRAPKRSRASTSITLPPLQPRTVSSIFADRRIIFESTIQSVFIEPFLATRPIMQRAGLTVLFDPPSTAYPRLVRLFYQNLRAEGSLEDIDSFRLTTTILGVTLSFTAADLAAILGFSTAPPEGMVEMPFTVPPLHIVRALSCGVADKGLCHRRSHMLPAMWVADYVLQANLFQSGHGQERRGRFQQALYAVFTERWFPIGREMLIAMWQATSRIFSGGRHRDTQILPYPRFITAIIRARAPSLLDRVPDSGRVTDFPEITTRSVRMKYNQGLSRHITFQSQHGGNRLTPQQALEIEATLPFQEDAIDLEDDIPADAPPPVPEGPPEFEAPPPVAPGAGAIPDPQPQPYHDIPLYAHQLQFQLVVNQGLLVDQLNTVTPGYGDDRYAFHYARAQAMHPAAYPQQPAPPPSQRSVPSYHPAPPMPRGASPSAQSSHFEAQVLRDFGTAGPSTAQSAYRSIELDDSDEE